MTTKKQNASKSDRSISVENGGMYEIRIKGPLDEHWKQWFEGMEMGSVTNGETGQECTLFTGSIADQPALHGLLAKIRDLNLTLISVRKLASEDQRNQGEDQGGANPEWKESL
jgi:hypothetical protein